MPKSIDHYAIVRELGRGAMGVVYVARDQKVDRDVALKIMQPGLLKQGGLERFQQEAQAVAKLRHPGIVTIHHLSAYQGRPYLVMDLIEGESLHRRLESRGPLDPKLAARVAGSLADALAHAHERGILHRDVKPDNVLIAASGHAVLTDFGLAKDLSASREQLTLSGAVVGTPGYLSPEQGRGAIHDVDVRSDVYGLGATLYAMLSGRAPFQGNPAELVRKVLEERPEPPSTHVPGIPKDLETICLKCLEKERADRYPSVGELAVDLKRFLDGQRVKASPRRVHLKGKTVALGALVVASLALVAGVALMPQSGPQAAPAKTPALTPTQGLNAQQQREADREFRQLRRVGSATKRIELARSWLERFAGHPLESRVRERLAEDMRSSPARVLALGEIPESRFQAHFAAIAFSDATTLAALRRGEISYWDTRSGDRLRTVRAKTGSWPKLAGVEGGIAYGGGQDVPLTWVIGETVQELDVRVDELAASPDRALLVVATRDARLLLYDVAAPAPRFEITLKTRRMISVGFTPDGTHAFLLAGDPFRGEGLRQSALTLYGLDGTVAQELPLPNGMSSCAAAVDTDRVLVGSWAGQLGLWDVAGRQGQAFLGKTVREHSLGMGQTAHSWGLREVIALRNATAWSLARPRMERTPRSSESQHPELAQWNVETGEQLRLLSRPFAADLAFSPDERILAISRDDGKVELWELER